MNTNQLRDLCDSEQCVTPAPQVEIIRSIIADPQWFATAFAIKSKTFSIWAIHTYPYTINRVESVVQASIVIITTAAGKLQDDTANDSLDPAVTLWLVYAFVCTAVSGALWVVANWFPTLLPAARLSQVKPSRMQEEVRMLLDRRAHTSSVGSDMNIARVDEGEKEDDADDDGEFEEKKLLSDEKALKKAQPGMDGMRWMFLVASAGIIAIGWIMFGLGVEWGVHGSVIAGTTGE